MDYKRVIEERRVRFVRKSEKVEYGVDRYFCKNYDVINVNSAKWANEIQPTATSRTGQLPHLFLKMWLNLKAILYLRQLVSGKKQ